MTHLCSVVRSFSIKTSKKQKKFCLCQAFAVVPRAGASSSSALIGLQRRCETLRLFIHISDYSKYLSFSWYSYSGAIVGGYIVQ